MPDRTFAPTLGTGFAPGKSLFREGLQMRLRMLLGAMAAAAVFAGCEPGPMKPETAPASRATPAFQSDSPRAGPAAISGERSIRLFGRGVNRDKQIRV